MTATASAAGTRHDPVTTEIVRNGLIAATEEMKHTLMRTAYNMIIYEALDFTVGLFDRDGNVLSIGIGLPMFIRGISETIKAKIRHFGLENIHPGDVLLTNDAYITGSHLNHMTFSLPIFHDGVLVGFAGSMAHWQDIGGTLDGMTMDIYSEGLQMPIVKAWRAGVANQDVLDIIAMNVRLPERAMGDLKAQLASIRAGERHMLEMARKHGREQLLASIGAIMDHSEALVRERVRAIPDGVYQAESFMDDDGVEAGARIPIRVKVTVAGDHMTIDLTDISKQVKGFYNSGLTAGLSCCQVAFKCLTSALDYPLNDGSFRPLSIILPPGRVVSAEKPAPMRWWMTFPMTIVDTVFKAMAPAMPDKVIAGHHADLVIASVNGYHPRDGRLFIYVGGLVGGGWGAKLTEDGVGAVIAINDGDTHNGPSEQVEVKFPLIVEEYALREDSGGPGRFRGGLGTVQRVRALADISFNAQIERVNCRPWGLDGGLSGAGNQVTIQRAGGEETFFPSGKVLAETLHAGDRYVLRSGGGGGFGPPLERAVEAVERDVIQGIVSREMAARCYGVVFDETTATADHDASATQRASMAAGGRRRDEDGLTAGGIRARDAAARAEAERSQARHAASHHHHGRHRHRHAQVRPEDDYELRLQLALARRCC